MAGVSATVSVAVSTGIVSSIDGVSVAVSVAVSVLPPHAAKNPATANTNNTFFIFVKF